MAFCDSDVADREHVGAHLVEDEEHLGGPAADPPDVGEPLDQRLVVERRPLGRIERARREMTGEVAQVVGLALREPAARAAVGSRMRRDAGGIEAHAERPRVLVRRRRPR